MGKKVRPLLSVALSLAFAIPAQGQAIREVGQVWQRMRLADREGVRYLVRVRAGDRTHTFYSEASYLLSEECVVVVTEGPEVTLEACPTKEGQHGVVYDLG